MANLGENVLHISQDFDAEALGFTFLGFSNIYIENWKSFFWILRVNEKVLEYT